MRKIFIFSIAAIALFASCKKSNPSIPAGISATFNDTSKDFSHQPYATMSHLTGNAVIQIIGTTATGQNIIISISNNLGGAIDSIVAGTYSDTSTRFSIEVEFFGFLSGSILHDYLGGTFVDGSEGHGIPATNHMVIKITSITSNSIKGTFSGNVYMNGDTSSAALSVTNASFNVAMKYI